MAACDLASARTFRFGESEGFTPREDRICSGVVARMGLGASGLSSWPCRARQRRGDVAVLRSGVRCRALAGIGTVGLAAVSAP